MDIEEMEELVEMGLDEKADRSRAVIARAFARYGSDGLAVAVTGGKDSTLLLRLVLDAAEENGLEPPEAVFIDEGDVFNEILDVLAVVRRDWGTTPTILKNTDLIGDGRKIDEPVRVDGLNQRNRRELARLDFTGGEFPFDPESPVGNHLTKTVPLNEYLETSGKKALLTAIRWDEHESRLGEDYESPRREPPHMRVHPILHFLERDVWDYTLKNRLPFCVLYTLGYRSLGTKFGTVKNDDVPAWEQDLENTPERAGRGRDKEAAMEQLRALGYM